MIRWILVLSLFYLHSLASIAADFPPEMLMGQTTCIANSKFSLKGYFVPFEKDPEAFSFGDTLIEGRRYILVVKNDPDKKNCGTIISFMKVNYSLRADRYESIGFNCAVLKEPYSRHKSYIGIYQANSLEYSKAIIAWVFDFDTEKFEPYSKNKNVYCANFIAD